MGPKLTRILWLLLATIPISYRSCDAALSSGAGLFSSNNPVPLRPKLLAKEIFIQQQNGRPPASGFVTYIHPTKPILMHCSGWEDYSDGYDDYAVSISADNGKTWTKPEVRWKGSVVPEGRMRYAEPAACFDADKGKLIVLIDHTLYPKDKLNVDTDYGLELNIYDTRRHKWTERRELKFPGQRTPAMSFSFPLKTARGRLLFPGMRKTVDASGKAVHYQKTWAPLDEVATVIGEYDAHGELLWRLGQPLNIAPELSSRGLDENTSSNCATAASPPSAAATTAHSRTSPVTSG